MIKEKLVEGKDVDNNEVKVLVRRPSYKDQQDAQVEYNRAFRQALEGGALLREKLLDHMRLQGIWDDEKQKKYDSLIDQIRDKELLLKKGGVRLNLAKKAALECADLRNEFKDLISERTSLDTNSAQGQADNARFNMLVVCCAVNPTTKERVFKSLDDYYTKSSEDWVVSVAGELGNMLYDIDPDYDRNLPENKFLVEYKFADEKLRLINKDGHLVDRDGRLIDEDGKYVKYDSEGKKYFADRDGNPVDVEFTAFLEDETP